MFEFGYYFMLYPTFHKYYKAKHHHYLFLSWNPNTFVVKPYTTCITGHTKITRSKIFEGESFLGLSQSFLFRAFCVKSSGTGEVAESFFGFIFLITLNLGLVM